MKLKNFIVASLIILFLIVTIIARNSSEAAFFIGDAIAMAIAFLIIILTTEGKVRTLSEGVFLLTISNLLDELFFDPFVLTWNERLFGVLIVFYTLYKLIRKDATDIV